LKVALNTIKQTNKNIVADWLDEILILKAGAGRKAKRMVLQCINGVGSNPVEGRTKI
jgi:hypothetical protein